MVTRGKVLGGVVSDRLGVWDGHVHSVIFKIDNQQGPTVKKKSSLKKKILNLLTLLLEY